MAKISDCQNSVENFFGKNCGILFFHGFLEIRTSVGEGGGRVGKGNLFFISSDTSNGISQSFDNKKSLFRKILADA